MDVELEARLRVLEDRMVIGPLEAATAYEVVLQELMVELCRVGALRPLQIVKVLLRARSVMELSDNRTGAHELALDTLEDSAIQRLGVLPAAVVLRNRARTLRAAWDRDGRYDQRARRRGYHRPFREIP